MVTSKVEIPSFPRPLNLPILYEMLPFNISCDEIYLYSNDGEVAQGRLIEDMLNRNLKRYCNKTQNLSPKFEYKEEMNKYMIEILK